MAGMYYLHTFDFAEHTFDFAERTFDFAERTFDFVSQVMFWVGEDCFNMVSDFTIAVWCCYVSNMVARPDLESKGAQKVLHYLISNPDLMVRSWRARLYQFGSGTFFKDCGEELRLWLEHPDSDQKLEVRETYHAKRMDLLRRLNNEDGLYGVLGDLIYSFIDLKKTPFHCVRNKIFSLFLCGNVPSFT